MRFAGHGCSSYCFRPRQGYLEAIYNIDNEGYHLDLSKTGLFYMSLQLGRFRDVLRRKTWDSVHAVHVNSMTLRQSTNC